MKIKLLGTGIHNLLQLQKYNQILNKTIKPENTDEKAYSIPEFFQQENKLIKN